MSKRSFIFGVLVGIPLGWVCILLLSEITTYLSGVDRQKVSAFQTIAAGMSRAEVTKLMGSDGKRSETFHLGQRAGYEIEYGVAERIGAAYFISWETGIDLVFTVAFDQEGRVIYKASGSS